MFKRKTMLLTSVVFFVLCIFVLVLPAIADDSPLSFSKFCHQYLSSMTRQPGMAHIKVTTDIVKPTSDKYSVTATMEEDSNEKSVSSQSITGYLFDGNEATGKFEIPGSFTVEAGRKVSLNAFSFSAPDGYWIGLEISCSDGQTFWYIRQLPDEGDKIEVSIETETTVEVESSTEVDE